MKVLYFIPKIKGNVSEQSAYMFIRNIMGIEERHVLTPRTENKLHIEGINVHNLSSYPFMIRRNHKRFKKIVNRVNPDLIHILGAWDITASYIGKWGMEYRIPIILSPLKGFAPWNIRNRYFTQKLPSLLFFQSELIKTAHAIHAISRQELNFIKEINWHPSLTAKNIWNERITVIPNPEFTNETDVSEMSQSMLKLYNKVLDSNPFMRMTTDDRKMENTLLRAGLSKDSLSSSVTNDDKERLKAMDDESWRRILLHATDQGISNIIINGALTMQLKRKSIVIENIERFGNGRKDNISVIKGKAAFTGTSKMERIRAELKGYDTEAEICTMLVNFIHEMKHNRICRKHIADIYTAIRFRHYDEDVLRFMLKKMNIIKDTARLLQIINETIGLETGFMPLKPLNDRKTNSIRNTFFKSEIQ